MTVQEVADYLRVHTSTIYRMTKAGAIPCFKIGSNFRFDRTTIDAWTVARSIKPRGPQLS
jgi:excisionase family DNA binding protein